MQMQCFPEGGRLPNLGDSLHGIFLNACNRPKGPTLNFRIKRRNPRMFALYSIPQIYSIFLAYKHTAQLHLTGTNITFSVWEIQTSKSWERHGKTMNLDSIQS